MLRLPVSSYWGSGSHSPTAVYTRRIGVASALDDIGDEESHMMISGNRRRRMDHTDPSGKNRSRFLASIRRWMRNMPASQSTILILFVPLGFFAVALLACWMLLVDTNHGGAWTRSSNDGLPIPRSPSPASVSSVSSVAAFNPRTPLPTRIDKDANELAWLEQERDRQWRKRKQKAASSNVNDGEPTSNEQTADPDAITLAATSSRGTRWQSHWISIRQALGSLSFDISHFFPPQPERPPITLRSLPIRRAQWPKTAAAAQARAGGRTSFHPPPTPPPTRLSWVAGRPAFEQLFVRDTCISFLLMFTPPVMGIKRQLEDSAQRPPGYRGPWDLSSLHATSNPPRPFPFSSLFHAHPSTPSTFLSDLSHLRSTLYAASTKQGIKIDARSGEEIGKIPHQFPGVDLKLDRHVPTRNTMYAASDATQLWMLTLVHYIHLSNDFDFLKQMLPKLVAGYMYIVAHVDRRSGLFIEDPAKFLQSADTESDATAARKRRQSPAGYALRVTYWKDSTLLHRASTNQGSPAYPVAYFIVQTQTIAAVRALRNLQEMLRSWSQLHATTRGGDQLAALSHELDAALEKTSQPNVNHLLQLLLRGMHTHFLHRPISTFSSPPLHPDDNPDSQLPLSVDPLDDDPADRDATGSFPPSSIHHSRNQCPLFGIDREGSLSLPPQTQQQQGADSGGEFDELVTNDILHGLFYLEEGDLTEDQLQWFKPRASSSTQTDGGTSTTIADASSQLWTPSCFQVLETPLGYATSGLGRIPISPEGSGPSSAPEHTELPRTNLGRAALYHHRSVWGFEQALIHIAAKRFGLKHVQRVAERYFRRYERETLRRRREMDASSKGMRSSSATTEMDVFPEYFLPSSLASLAVASEYPPFHLRKLRDSHTERAEDWIGQGCPMQLWTVASWNYWINTQSYKAWSREQQRIVRGNDEKGLAVSPTTPSLTPPSMPEIISSCATNKAQALRGVPVDDRHRYCPFAPASSSSSSPASYPASIFSCLDGSSMLWLSQVNDDYCDCMDGSDERGTSACAHSDEEHGFESLPFECESLDASVRGWRGVPTKKVQIHASMVDDGVCDCCDGSDEMSGHIQCPNRCGT